MNYSEWQARIARDCERAIPVRGGAFCCGDDGIKEYCGFLWCPRRKDLQKESE